MKYQVDFYKDGKLFFADRCTYKNDFHAISCHIMENIKDVVYKDLGYDKVLIVYYNNGNRLEFRKITKK